MHSIRDLGAGWHEKQLAGGDCAEFKGHILH